MWKDSVKIDVKIGGIGKKDKKEIIKDTGSPKRGNGLNLRTSANWQMTSQEVRGASGDGANNNATWR